MRNLSAPEQGRGVHPGPSASRPALPPGPGARPVRARAPARARAGADSKCESVPVTQGLRLGGLPVRPASAVSLPVSASADHSSSVSLRPAAARRRAGTGYPSPSVLGTRARTVTGVTGPTGSLAEPSRLRGPARGGPGAVTLELQIDSEP